MSKDNNQDTNNNEIVDSLKNDASEVKRVESKPDTEIQTEPTPDEDNNKGVDSLKNDASSEVKPVEIRHDTEIQTEPIPDEDNNETVFDDSDLIPYDKSSPVIIRDKNGTRHDLIYDSKKYRVSLKNGIEIAKTIKVKDPITNEKVEEIHFETLSFVPIAPIKKYINPNLTVQIITE